MREFRARMPHTDDALYRRIYKPQSAEVRLEPLTAEEIADRAEFKSRLWRNRLWWFAAAGVVVLAGITEPAHTWLRAHLEFLWGVLAGTLLQVPGWLRDRWKLRQNRPTYEEFPGGDSCGDDAIRWVNHSQMAIARKS